MLRLRDIMVTDVLTISPDTTIREAMDMLVERHISGVPVVANGHVIGIISATDLLAFSASLPGVQEADTARADWGEDLSEWSEGNEAPGAYFAEMWGASGEVGTGQPVMHGPEWNALEEHTVAEAMTSPPLCTLPPNATVEDAAEFMHATGVHRVLVMDSGRLTGIVTSMDVARAVGERRLTPQS